MSVADWAEQGGGGRGPGLDLGAWVASIDGAREQAALKKLAQLPLAPGRASHVLHPFGFVDRSFFKDVFPGEVIHAAIEQAPIVPVPLDHIVGIQHSVTPRTVAQYIEQGGLSPAGLRSPDHGGPIDWPICVRYREVNCAYDGHNRLTSVWCLGAKEWPMRFVDLDDPDVVRRAAELAASGRT